MATTTSPSPSTPPKPFYKKWWFIAICVLVVIGIFVPKSKKTGAPAASTTTAPAATDASETSGGIGVSRSDISTAMGSRFSETKGTDVGGKDNYVYEPSDKSGAWFQLIGPKDNLSQASVSMILDATPETTKRTLGHMGHFVQAIDKEALDWVVSEMRKVVSGDVSAKESYENFKRINRRRYQINYTPIAGTPTFTLSVKPA